MPIEVNECPVQDVPLGEPGSLNGAESLQSEQASSLAEGFLALAKAIDQQNIMLGQIVAQNADLIAMMLNEEQEQDEPQYDLSGRPLT